MDVSSSITPQNNMGNCFSSNPEDDELQPYIYEPLSGPNTIRVLNLHTNADESISCSLRQIEISAGGYQALSYVWGSSTTTHRAIVKDDKGKSVGYLELTRNLWNALHDLRNCTELVSKVFWIDQICIDQHGSEKGAQVGLMGEIFSGGTRTITYLGPSDDASEEAQGTALLNKISSHFEPNYQVLSEFDDLPSAWERQSELPITGLPTEIEELPYERWMWICNLAYPEWATRLWIVQEQLLPGELVMLRGTSLFAFETLALLSVYFDLGILPEVHANRFWQEQRPRGQLEPFNVARAVYQLWKQRLMNKKSTKSIDLSLLENIVVYQKLRCQDSRDRFYALLGISADRNVLDIVPKYSQDSALDIRQLCARTMQRTQNFLPLTIACSWNDLTSTSIPSWAFETPRAPDARVEAARHDVYSPHPLKSRTKPIQFSADCLVATFRGRILDRISFVTPQIPIMRQSNLENKLKKLQLEFSAMAAIWKRNPVNLENTARLGRILVASYDWTPEALGEHDSLIEKQAYCFWCYFRDQRDYLIDMADTVEENVTDEISYTYKLTDTLRDIFLSKGLVEASPIQEEEPLKYGVDSASEEDDPNGISKDEEDALEELSKELRIGGRTLCVTEKNRLCNGMNEIREDDVIAALEGADKLFILRPVGSRYQLVGDVYVDGLMNGEAYEGLNPHEVDYDIELI
jgi:hypothetical protein